MGRFMEKIGRFFFKEVLEVIGAVEGVEVDGRIRLKSHL